MQDFEKTPEETRQMLNTRNSVFTKLKMLAFLQLPLSALSIAVGIATVVYTSTNPAFPYNAGAPIYSPVFAIIGAVLALLAVQEGTNDISSRKYKCYINTMPSMYWTANSLCLMSFAWGIVGAVHCKSTNLGNLAKCLPHNSELFILSILAAIVGIALAVISVTSNCLFYCNRRSLFENCRKGCC